MPTITTPPLTALAFAASLLKECENAKEVQITIKDAEALSIDDQKFDSDANATTHLIALAKTAPLLMASCDFAPVAFPADPKDRSVFSLMGPLNKHLQFRSYLGGHRLSTADIIQFVLLGKMINFDISKLPGRTSFPHVFRWFDFIRNLSFVSTLLPKENEAAGETKTSGPTASPTVAKTEAEKLEEMERSFASKLPGAVMGEVVTRFPPEPSGYLHVGHAKAALLNSFYARYFKGKLLVRFDDTNPTKEKAEFEESIVDDLKTLGVEASEPISYTSDYFPQLQNTMEKWLTEGKAYVDDTPTDEMRQERFDGVESKCRNLSVDENIRRWREMLAGSIEGQTMCCRAKIDMKDNNKCMRDPVMYRVNLAAPHHRTGTQYKAYPTYDFACPLVDSWSGVTHALRTNEYADRIPQYYWVQDAEGVRRTTVYEFSRLNLCNTVLSKRKLTWLVQTGVVEGWDDPRFPTVRGMIRRGLLVQAMHEFIIEQGPSKNTNLMEWDKIWNKNARILDPIAPRYMAVSENAVPLRLSDVSGEAGIKRRRALHPKNPAVGEVDMYLTPTIYLDAEDAAQCMAEEEITLMRMGNCVIDKRVEEGDQLVALEGHLKLDGDVKLTKKKLHWIPNDQPSHKRFKFLLREFSHIITKKKPEDDDQMEDIINRNSVFDTVCLGEYAMADLKEGDFLQIERRGYCRVDRVSNGLLVLNKIPDGKTKAMSSLSTKVDAASLVKGGAV